jgi:hypothetical protein
MAKSPATTETKEKKMGNNEASGGTRVFLVAGQSNAMGLAEPIRSELERRQGSDFRIVHVAEGGTPLANAPYCRASWHPERRGEMYDRLIQEAQKISDEIAAGGGRAVFPAMFWVQGEQVTKTDNRGDKPGATSLPPPPQPLAASSYESNLRCLIAAVRRDLRAPDMAFVIATTPVGTEPDFVLEGSRHAGTPQVVAAQKEVARSTARAALVLTDGLTRAPDRVHFSAEGGRALAAAMVRAYENLD